MDQLLNFDAPFDVSLLEELVGAVYGEDNVKRNIAQTALTQLKEHPQSWTRVDTILEHARHLPSKFYALQILNDLIQFRWRILPADQRDGIRNYIIGLVLKLSATDEALAANRLILEKLNVNLVQILKHDWPSNWQSFIPEIISASKTNECVCENNMKILKTLSEEVFDFSKGSMTQSKIRQLKDSLNSEFYQIFQLCDFVMGNSQKPKLLLVTLETLLRYLSWIPLGYIFETGLVNTLISRFLIPSARVTTLQCLSEIVQLNNEKIADAFAQIFVMFMQKLYEVLPGNLDIRSAYASGDEEYKHFVLNLAMFMGTFFANHRKELERDQLIEMLMNGHSYLLQMSLVDDLEVFRVCLDYWQKLASELYHEAPVSVSPLMLGDQPIQTKRREVYKGVLSKVRDVVISRMAKPEEVIVVEDENGNIVKEVRSDGEQVTRYKLMRSVLVYLTHLDYQDTQGIMVAKLNSQMEPSGFHWGRLNTLCWAIGSIADTLSESAEKLFLVKVIKDLLTLCEDKKGKDNKAVIASNIMYVVGQYPRFLQAHWKFLTTVIFKLFEFMHELHPGVQDMSCDTFLKIVSKVKGKFAVTQDGDNEPFTITVIQNIPSIIADLNDVQIQAFYEAVGHMVSYHQPQDMERVVSRLMDLPNATWCEIMSAAGKNPAILRETEAIRKLASVLKVNVHTCAAIGGGFISQIAKVYLDLLNVCKYYSAQISGEIATKGADATKHAIVKDMRIVKRESMKFITTFIGVTSDTHTIINNFLPPLLPSVLEDYRASVPAARDHEVLSLLAKIIYTCKQGVAEQVPLMLGAIFECTLQMITSNFEDFPDIRVEFYNFLLEANRHCFTSLKRMAPEQFKMIVHSVVWAFKHTMRNISEIGLQITLEMLQQINNDNSEVANSFYQSYFLFLLQDLLYILTDTFHKSGFKLQTQILSQMLLTVEEGRVTVPLQPSQQQQDNRTFLRNYVMELLAKSFPNLTSNQVQQFVVGLFELLKDHAAFSTHLRDFLVQLKEFSGDDNSALFHQEHEAERLKLLQHDLSVPGLVGPHDPRREEGKQL